MMNWEADREWLAVEEWQVPLNCEYYQIPAGGYLAGVSATVSSFEDWHSPDDIDGAVRAELTDYDGTVRGRFIIPIGHGFHKGGVLLPELLPNLNTASPYRLRFLDRPPALRLYIIQCWVNTADTIRDRDERLWKRDLA